MKRRGKTLRVRRRRTGKKRLYKKIRKLRAYSKPDGQHKAVFVYQANVSRTGDSGSLYVNWNCNTNIIGQDITQCPEYILEASLWEQRRVRGVKIEFYPDPFEQATNNARMRCFHMASWPYDSSAAIQALTHGVNQMIQRRDYKCYSGRVFKVKRYYNLMKTYNSKRFYAKTFVNVRNAAGTGVESVVKDSFTNTNINRSGWAPVSAELGEYDMGVTQVFFDTTGYNTGDIIGRIVIKWYVDFKERRVV